MYYFLMSVCLDLLMKVRELNVFVLVNGQTCMLLYLLKVLKQRGQENWVGPIRIWEGVGIQYWWPLFIIPLPLTSSLSEFSEEYIMFEAKSAELVVVGSPKCKATVTLVSSSINKLCLSTSMAAQEDSPGLVGLRLRRGRASLSGELGKGWGVLVLMIEMPFV